MFKMLDKLQNHWEQMKRQSAWYIFVMAGEMLAFVVGAWYIFYMIAPYLENLPCFSDYSRFDIALSIFLIFFLLTTCIIMAWQRHAEREEKKAKDRLKNREPSDYVKKYQKYVDFVKSLLQTGEYSEVYLSDDWFKDFDEYLDMTARLRARKEQDFTDFEVMACLMYALTYKTVEDGSIMNVPFAFHCAKAFLQTPNVYECKRIEGYELILEPSESLKEVSFANIDASTLLETQEFIGVYLSRREYYSQILELADFLYIFYLRCEK